MPASTKGMTPLQRRFKIALLQQDKNVKEVARTIGLSPGTVWNIIGGGVCSDAARKAITNALGVQLWDDVPVTERYLHIPSSCEMQFEFPHEQQALAAADEWGPDVVTRCGKTITFIKPVTFVAKIEPEEPSSHTKNLFKTTARAKPKKSRPPPSLTN